MIFLNVSLDRRRSNVCCLGCSCEWNFDRWLSYFLFWLDTWICQMVFRYFYSSNSRYIDGVSVRNDTTTPYFDAVRQSFRFTTWGSVEAFAGNFSSAINWKRLGNGIDFQSLPSKAYFKWVKHYPLLSNGSISTIPGNNNAVTYPLPPSDFVDEFNFYDSNRWSFLNEVNKGSLKMFSR